MVTTLERFQIWINFEIKLSRRVLIFSTVFDSVPHEGTQLFLIGTNNVQDHSEMFHFLYQLLNILTISSIFSIPCLIFSIYVRKHVS